MSSDHVAPGAALSGRRSDPAVGVVVPARNEAHHIDACLASIHRSLIESSCSVWCIVVVVDQCDDRTVDIARSAIGGRATVLTLPLGNAGAARRAGAARAVRLLRQRRDPSASWLLSTDADSVVPEHWIEGHLRYGRTGATAVAGTVELGLGGPSGMTDPRLHERFRRAYDVQSDAPHPHVHGANLAVRADAYLAVGGWEALRTGEDHALWARLRQTGWPTVSARDVAVVTSARQNGRAPHGFAEFLDELAHDGSPIAGPPRRMAPQTADEPLRNDVRSAPDLVVT